MHGFLPPAYCYMNTIIILTGLWAIATPDSKDSVLMVRYTQQHKKIPPINYCTNKKEGVKRGKTSKLCT